ncbi:hypothetical protein EYW49_20130 [Siculibacillus lacustris]|uniref:Magnesium transporter MgtE intracellular domain-containing protein n=1 Tax=Siculibacillus lacustris TaxID=1549641 RepID=A0A4Q9VF50_9HYPH|nr:hypothetical protein [Siculibacillus lacustris]TBW33487.1 hypothetical protein EYW49_20130 [Siculibacillus lacustris]
MIQIRLLPIVVMAAVVLLGLKVVEFGHRARPAESVVVDAVTGQEIDMIATGSSAGGGHGGAEEKPKEDAHGAAPPAAGGVQPSKVDTKVTGDKPPEARPVQGQELIGEIEILQKLAERRKKLEELERQVNMREDLLKASEDRIGRRVDELKTLEDKIGGATKAKEDAKKQELSDLVKMYEGMKAKDAARVFDKLEIGLLGEIARQMNPKKLGDVVSKMSSDQAEKLTVELANRRTPGVSPQIDRELPKIQGKSG